MAKVHQSDADCALTRQILQSLSLFSHNHCLLFSLKAQAIKAIAHKEATSGDSTSDMWPFTCYNNRQLNCRVITGDHFSGSGDNNSSRSDTVASIPFQENHPLSSFTLLWLWQCEMSLKCISHLAASQQRTLLRTALVQ